MRVTAPIRPLRILCNRRPGSRPSPLLGLEPPAARQRRYPQTTARQHGHSVQVMLSTYGVWIEGASEADVAAIKASIEAEATGARLEREVPCTTPASPEFATNMPPTQGWGRLSWRKVKHFNSLTGGADGTRTRRGHLQISYRI